MINIYNITIDMNKFNIDRKKAEAINQVFKEVSVRLLRPDGLVEERNCKMIDLLKLCGFEVHDDHPKNKENKPYA